MWWNYKKNFVNIIYINKGLPRIQHIKIHTYIICTHWHTIVLIAVLRFLNSARDIHSASHDYVKTGVFLRTQYMCLCAQMCRYYMFRCMRGFICICVVEYLCLRTEEITNVKENRVTNLLKQQQTLAARLTDWKHTHTHVHKFTMNVCT